MSEEFSTDSVLYKCYDYIYAPKEMPSPDFKIVRLKDEVSVDPYLIESTKLKLIKAGAKWLRVIIDDDGDAIIEGWKSFLD